MRNLKEMTDEELALAYVEGDNKAFDLLLAHNEVKLFSYIMFVVHDEEVANDIFQETFVKAIVKLQNGAYSPNGKFSAWLMRIAHNVIIDGYRDIKHQRIVDQLSRMKLEEVWLVGSEFEHTATPAAFRKFENVAEVKEAIASEKPRDRYILIKGSNGTRLFELPEML